MFPVDATRFSADVMAYLFVAFACGAFGGCRKHNKSLCALRAAGLLFWQEVSRYAEPYVDLTQSQLP